MNNNHWVPEIVYEEVDDGITSNIPFVSVPDDEEMPPILFIFESRDTGEVEPGPEGEELPVTELELHQYVNMTKLKFALAPEAYDDVRRAVGLEPMSVAVEKGQNLTNRVRKNLGV